jgi:hypothetical protein
MCALTGCAPKVVSDMYTYEFAPQPADSVQASLPDEPEFKNKQDDRPENVLRVAVGPSWLVSKFETYRRIYKKKDGLDITADYAHVWKSGFGVGVNYLHNYTSFDEGFDTRVNYVGPCADFVYDDGTWRWGAGIGIGYGCYTESAGSLSHTENNLATLIRLNAEYMASKNFGIGLQANMFTMRMKKPEDFELKENEVSGIQRMGIQLSLNYYF